MNDASLRQLPRLRLYIFPTKVSYWSKMHDERNGEVLPDAGFVVDEFFPVYTRHMAHVAEAKVADSRNHFRKTLCMRPFTAGDIIAETQQIVGNDAGLQRLEYLWRRLVDGRCLDGLLELVEDVFFGQPKIALAVEGIIERR